LLVIKDPNQSIPSDINESKNITFFALGDAGKGNFAQWRVAKAMEEVAEKNKKLDFIAVLGDNFYTSGDLGLKSKVWNAYFENVYSGRFLDAIPFYAVLGNHDKLNKIKDELAYSEHNGGSNRWRMPAKFYARDMGSIGGRPLLRVVFLDTQPNVESLKIQADFIQKSFAENTKQPVWRIVIGHHPVRNYGKHADETALMQQYILPALKEAKIDTYISGHDHNQQAIVNQN
jgi:predicted phosphodiesterase